MFREKEGRGKGRSNNFCHFSDIFFLVFFYVNIQPSCPKTRMEYVNIKIRLLIRET